MKKIFIFSILLINFSFISIAQQHTWASKVSGSNKSIARNLEVINDSIIYTLGIFSGTVDFDPGNPTSNLSSNGNNDVYLMATDITGSFLWVKQFGGSGIEHSRDLVIDDQGNICITGSFSNTADFDPSTSTFNLTSNGNIDAFFVKLDPTGNLMLAKSFGGSGDDQGLTIETDTLGSFYIGGGFSNIVDFDPSIASTVRTAAGNEDSFIAKYDANGNFIWVNTYGSNINGSDRVKDFARDANDNIYFVGNFTGTIDIDPSPAVLNLTSNGSEDAYVGKMTPSGSILWAKSYGGSDEVLGISLDLGSNDNIHISGSIQGNVNLDPNGNQGAHVSAGSKDAYILKLTSNGNYIWSKIFGSASAELCRSVEVDKDENIFATGYYFTDMDFDPDTSMFLANGGNNSLGDGFLLKLDKDGKFNWVYTINHSDYGTINRTFLGKKKTVFIVGSFNGTFDFDMNSGSDILTSTASTSDAFFQKISDCTESDTLINAIACKTYTSPSGNYIWKSTGMYNDTLVNADGCDSLISINLFVIEPDTMIIVNDPVLTSNANNSSFQWLDCNNSYSIIAGETSSSFAATSNGSYALEITTNGCSDTTACYNILTIGLESNDAKNLQPSIFPNPSDGNIHITLLDRETTKVNILDITGKIVFERQVFNHQNITLDLNLKSGIYFISFEGENSILNVEKLIIR